MWVAQYGWFGFSTKEYRNALAEDHPRPLEIDGIRAGGPPLDESDVEDTDEADATQR